MAGILTVSPLFDPASYNTIIISGVSSPGACILTGADRKFTWDTKRAAGTQGTTITYRGWELATPQVKFQLWTDTLIRQFYDEFVPVLAFDATKAPVQGLRAYHPLLATNQIDSLVTTNIGQLIDEGAQLWTVTVDFLEFRPAKIIKTNNATPASVATEPIAVQSFSRPSVLDDLDREIDRLWIEYGKPF